MIDALTLAELRALPFSDTWRRVTAAAVCFAVTQPGGGPLLRFQLAKLSPQPQAATVGELPPLLVVLLPQVLARYLGFTVPDAAEARALLAVLRRLSAGGSP